MSSSNNFIFLNGNVQLLLDAELILRSFNVAVFLGVFNEFQKG